MFQISDTISTYIGDGTQRGLPRGTIYATPSQLPLFIKDPGGVFRETQNPAPSGFTDAWGRFAVSLPWPSECAPNSITWNLYLPDGTVYQGVVPEGVTGPVGLYALKNSYSWSTVGAPVPQTAVSATSLNNGSASLLLNVDGTFSLTGPAPSVSVLSGLGSSPPAPVLSGTNARGKITFGTGASGTTSAAILHLAFSQALSNAPTVLLNLGSVPSAGVSYAPFAVNVTASGFDIQCQGGPLPTGLANQVIFYHVIG